MGIKSILAKWFSRNTTAQVKTEIFEPEKSCKLGTTEEEMFAPQTFLSFFACYQVMKTGKPFIGNVDEVIMLNFFNKYPHGYTFTAFAIKAEKGYFWGRLGEKEVHYSLLENAEKNLLEDYSFNEADRFRIHLQGSLYAVCQYGYTEKIPPHIEVEGILFQEKFPPTDGDLGRWVGEKKDFPCTLERAREIAAKL